MTPAEQAAFAAYRIGVIMLDTAFPRPVGDIGNPETFAGRALFEVVPGASVARLDEPGLALGFITARDRLVRRGADLITTSCGFLVTHQTRLQAGCPVPVVSSAMLQIPRRAAELRPGQRLGVFALDSRRLTFAMLEAAGAGPDIAIQGLEHGHTLLRVIGANDPRVTLDPAAATRDVVEAGLALRTRVPEIGAIVMECANLPPYRLALSEVLGMPVFDILTLLAETLLRPTVTD